MNAELAKMSKRYNPEEVERRWLSYWDDSLYYYEDASVASGEKEPYIIDTPPPYPTGDFHIGNALNWCYIDFIARYKRMRGYEVMFPQGWDCHGLPTEVKVEETHRISKREVSKQEFRRMCEELTMRNIKQMREMMRRLGFSIDWSREFVTMDDSYKKFTQRSFIRMFRDGWIYRAEHPVNWCPRCETAIAFAEVEYEERESYLNYILFKRVQADSATSSSESDDVVIATTRPELLASCVAVAVNPSDERYSHLRGEMLEVPIFGHHVRVFEDENVDPSFGTGVVMICTFGDRQDVRWWKEHRLPLRVSIDGRGRMTSTAGKYEGMSVEECRNRIVEDLEGRGLLLKRERIKQSVGVCWRCKTPIEIISAKQWFIRVPKKEVKEAARRIRWHPEHFRLRLENWVDSMEWDWCISRQRIFAVPIPVWYCKQCGAVKLPSEDELPVDASEEKPKSPCEKCGSRDFIGEEDVLDTWMDSSLSALWVAGWNFNDNDNNNNNYKPVELRPQGHDIIRTWAFYTILRTLALTGEIPWRMILINGMVLGEDGFKMSKSRNNIISPDEVVSKHGADAFRQWAATGGAVGSDVQFRWKDIVAASKFLQKMWSILRFSMIHLADYTPPDENFAAMNVIDKWLLAKLKELVDEVTDAMEKFKFDEALKRIKAFAWDVLADDYIEIAKARLYGDSVSGDAGRESARFALFTTMKTLSILLAPFMPFFAEEMYQRVVRKVKTAKPSVHQERWPEIHVHVKPEEVHEGDIIAEIVRTVRRLKAERRIPLNKPLRKIEIFSPEPIDTEDLKNATASPVMLRSSDRHAAKAEAKAKADSERVEFKISDVEVVVHV